ncbi:MAG: mannosyltransferase family protein [Corynebacterium sp.]|uniref:mannosyltransferase family protein n=1 Tax=Corynebacterium sp. TaxID=1720 RepID=UPI0026DF39E0|nr:mannosyltransferase family protein [Corynebacterium sp.]MDO5670809.1 mannosyltransferase family protein [Corynebacterium sp.]
MTTSHPRLRLLIDAAFVFLITSVVRVATLGVLARANDDSLNGLLGKWDAQYYLAIAEFGYFDAPLATDVPVHHRTLAFFPGYPLLVRGFHEVTRLDYATSAAVVSMLAGVAMTAGAMMIARLMGADRLGQFGAGILMSSAPMAITYAMPYSEALFGALAFWAIVALMQRRWGWAAVLILLLGFTRLTAVAMIGVFGLTVLLKARRDPRAWACLAVTPWSLAAYLWWASAHTREVGGYFGIQALGWHSGFDFGVATVRWVWEVLTTSTEGGYLLSVGVMVAAVITLIAAWGRLPGEAWWFAAAIIATVLLSDGIMHSRPRLLLPAAILLLPWVLIASRRLSRPAFLALAGGWVVFGAWFSAYMLAVFEWAI